MTLKELAEAAARKVAGFAGNAINTIGSKFNSNQSTSNKSGSTDWSSTLQNWGGNKSGSGFGLVKVAHAAEPTQEVKVIKRNMSADGGHYDGDGNFTPYFPGTNTPDNSKKQSVTEKQGGGNGGGGNGDGGSNVDNNLMSEAEREYLRQKEAIMSRLQMMKEEAGRLRGQATDQYGFATGEISKNYGKLKELSAEKLKQAIEGLTQEDVGVQNTYGRVAGNSRRAMESAITRNRVLHRALGSLGSSFYSNAQGDTTNQGMNAVNDTVSEEAAKRAAIGTQTSAAKTDFATNDVAIGAEETSLKNTALTDYKNATAEADMLEKNYNIDSTDAIKQADNQLTSSLAAIKDYIQTKSLAAANTSTTQANSGVGANFVKSYDAITPIKSTLDNNQNLNNANKFIADTTTNTGNPSGLGLGGNIADANTPSYLTYLKNRTKKKVEDTSGYYQNVA